MTQCGYLQESFKPSFQVDSNSVLVLLPPSEQVPVDGRHRMLLLFISACFLYFHCPDNTESPPSLPTYFYFICCMSGECVAQKISKELHCTCCKQVRFYILRSTTAAAAVCRAIIIVSVAIQPCGSPRNEKGEWVFHHSTTVVAGFFAINMK